MTSADRASVAKPSAAPPVDTFPALDALAPRCVHAFLGRVPGVDVATDRAAALARLDAAHRELRQTLGLGGLPLVTAEQVHGRELAVVTGPPSVAPAPGADGLLTDQPNVVLGIYVADCGAIYLADPRRGAIGLVHSGKKGTELGIVPAAIRAMGERFGSRPADLIVQLGPCIRPPFYEVDFAAAIREQCAGAGVPGAQIHDCGRNTAAEPDRYYSYRMEKGRTGRMLALLALAGDAPPGRP